MKVRVRHAGATVKIECERTTTLPELSALAAVQLGIEGPITLSLNRKDALAGQYVMESGVCGGDLLHVLGPAVPAAAASPPPPVRAEPVPAPASTPLNALLEMGFASTAATQALQACDGSLDGAVGLLMAGAFDAPAVAAPTPTHAEPTPTSAPKIMHAGNASLQAAERRAAAAAAPMAVDVPPAGADDADENTAAEYEAAARSEFRSLLLQAGFGEGSRLEHDPDDVVRFEPPARFGLPATTCCALRYAAGKIQATPWDGAATHTMVFVAVSTLRSGGKRPALVDWLCPLLKDFKTKLIEPMLLELSLARLLLQAAASDDPRACVGQKETVALGLHSVMLCSGFTPLHSTAPAGALTLPSGWDLGGGTFSFEYTYPGPE
eukprot:COSAG05_NODE_2618_length_2832_cov_2.407977_2_plen_380_part_00